MGSFQCSGFGKVEIVCFLAGTCFPDKLWRWHGTAVIKVLGNSYWIGGRFDGILAEMAIIDIIKENGEKEGQGYAFDRLRVCNSDKILRLERGCHVLTI